MSLRIDVTPVGESSLGGVLELARTRKGGLPSADLLSAFEAQAVAARDNLQALERGALVVTTGQQPGLLGGPLYSLYKGLGAAAFAGRLSAELNTPVVPVFWVAGDDHDFPEGNHATILSTTNELRSLVLRERAADAPLLSLARELVGPEIQSVFAALRESLPETEFRAEALSTLSDCYAPEATLADAFASWVARVLGRWGVLVFRPYAAAAKQHSASLVVDALRQRVHREVAPGPIKSPDGATLVMVEGEGGRDRLIEGEGGFHARRSGERWSIDELKALAERAPERFSANVLLRPVLEAHLLPTVAYMAGPGELAYLTQAEPVYDSLGITRQLPVARFGARIVEGKVAKVLEKYGVRVEDLAGPPGQLESRLIRDELPDTVQDAFRRVRSDLGEGYEALRAAVGDVDPTMRKPVSSAKGSALSSLSDIEKRLINHLKHNNDTLVQQIEKARANLFPKGKPQERVFPWPMYAVRYGDALLDQLWTHAQRWAMELPLEGRRARS